MTDRKLLPQCIYLTGCDGTGKSTQAKLLVKRLEHSGVPVKHLWLRFPFLFSAPLLAFARWRGYSWHEEAVVRHGYWNFRQSWILRTLFPWVLFIDAFIAATFKLYLPLWRGETIVCERFVLDMLIDMAVAFDDPMFYLRPPARLFLRLLPRQVRVIVLDLDAESIQARRPDLLTDHHLEARLVAFRRMVAGLSLSSRSSKQPISVVADEIWRSLA